MTRAMHASRGRAGMRLHRRSASSLDLDALLSVRPRRAVSALTQRPNPAGPCAQTHPVLDCRWGRCRASTGTVARESCSMVASQCRRCRLRTAEPSAPGSVDAVRFSPAAGRASTARASCAGGAISAGVGTCEGSGFGCCCCASCSCCSCCSCSSLDSCSRIGCGAGEDGGAGSGSCCTVATGSGSALACSNAGSSTSIPKSRSNEAGGSCAGGTAGTGATSGCASTLPLIGASAGRSNFSLRLPFAAESSGSPLPPSSTSPPARSAGSGTKRSPDQPTQGQRAKADERARKLYAGCGGG